MILASTRLITLRHFPRPLIGMEQFLCFFTEGAAEKFRIEGFDLRIAMTEAQGHFLVKGIETLTARFGSLFIIDGIGWPPPPLQPPGQAITSTKS